MQNPKLIKCPICKKEKPHCAKGLCKACYQREGAPKIRCPICNREMPHHAKGMCKACYMKTEHYDKIQISNIKRYHNISVGEWGNITKKCIICGFEKIVDLHHLDGNKKNNNQSNLIGLCPNHHKMIHNKKYKDEVTKEILNRLSKK